jgi:hypothetical protein
MCNEFTKKYCMQRDHMTFVIGGGGRRRPCTCPATFLQPSVRPKHPINQLPPSRHIKHPQRTSHIALSVRSASMDLEDLSGELDCVVGKPQKENDGTKDAYVSYLVSTKVS